MIYQGSAGQWLTDEWLLYRREVFIMVLYLSLEFMQAIQQLPCSGEISADPDQLASPEAS